MDTSLRQPANLNDTDSNQARDEGVVRFIKKRLPTGVRRCIWYLSDQDYREQYGLNRRRYRTFRVVQALAWEFLWQQTQGRVVTGPFAGITYPSQSDYQCQKLLGTYELEIAPIVEQICGTTYQLVVNVGSADGYYSVGLAGRMPSATILAYESCRPARQRALRLAHLNCVPHRIKQNGFCDIDRLRMALNPSKQTLIVCDIDGGEAELLDPSLNPLLYQCDLLVETHDCFLPGVSQLLETRFTKSHQIQYVAQKARSLENWPSACHLEAWLQIAAMDEFRPARNSWIWMQSRSLERGPSCS